MRPDTPLKAITCFDAVMRTGSATLAAQRLFVTPGAVGQQLRKLEDWLGVQLFVRTVRKLQPTEDALRYWKQVRPALEQIDRVNSARQGRPGSQVSLSLPPAFASTWFARRLTDLTRRLPNVQLHLNAAAQTVDFRASSYDLAVRHFDGDDDSLNSRLLLVDEVKVYCSPEYRDRLRLFTVEDIHRATLIHTTSHANWSQWLAQSDVTFGAQVSGLSFDQSEMAIDAARRGQGVVLTSPWLVEDDLAHGRLLQLFAHALSTGKGYYLVYGKDKVLNAASKQLYDWILNSALKDVIQSG